MTKQRTRTIPTIRTDLLLPNLAKHSEINKSKRKQQKTIDLPKQ